MIKTFLFLLFACLPLHAQIAVGGAYQLSAVCIYSNNISEPCNNVDAQGNLAVWNTSDPTIATINSNGLATGLAEGSIQIYATASSIKSNVLTLVVGPAILSSVLIVPSSTTVALGKTVQFSATCVYSDGSTTSCSKKDSHGNAVRRWEITASANALANISSTGTLTGMAAGKISVNALVNSITSNAVTINVN